MLSIVSKGSTNATRKKLERLDRVVSNPGGIDAYGRKGVDALSSATPIDSGGTASRWGYNVIKTPYGFTLQWYNTNVNDGVNVAVLIQYGHGTGTGGYVEGINYINPAIRPIFEKIKEDLKKEVRRG